MAKVVVVYHSGYGHTRRQSEVVAEGAGAVLIAIDAEADSLPFSVYLPSPLSAA